MKIFDKYSMVYDLLYAEKDTKSEVIYLNNILAKYGMHKANILEFGSGTGRHALELAKLGHVTHGIELSAAMVEQALKHVNCSYEVGNILNIDLERTFDCVMSNFHVASYQISNANITSFFSAANRHLRKGGKFIFDYWYTPAVYEQKPQVRVKKVENLEIQVTRTAQPKICYRDNRVTIDYTLFVKDKINNSIHTFSETHILRHFSIPELELLAKNTGFKLISSFEPMTHNEPSGNSWGVISIFEKT